METKNGTHQPDEAPGPEDRVRTLGDATLQAAARRTWAACTELEDEGNEQAAELLHSVAYSYFLGELERRQRLMASARIDVEFCGHLATARHDHAAGVSYADCRCGWSSGPTRGLEETKRVGREHAEALGGRWGDQELVGELFGPVHA